MIPSSCVISDTIATLVNASAEPYLDIHIMEQCAIAVINLARIASMVDHGETYVSDDDWDLLQESLEHLNTMMAEMTDD